MTNTLEHDIIKLQEINDYMGSEEFQAAIKAKTEEVFPAELLQGITENLKAEIESILDKQIREQEIESMPFKYFFSCDGGEAYTVEQIYDEYIQYAKDDFESFDDFCDCLTAMGSETVGFFTLEELEEFALDYTNEDTVTWHDDNE